MPHGPLAILTVAAGAAAMIGGVARAQSAPSAQSIVLAVDADDDDADRVADRAQQVAPAGVELRSLASLGIAAATRISIRGDAVRLIEEGRAVEPSAARGRGRLELQAVKPGRAELDAGGRKLTLGAVELLAVDGAGKRVELASSHATLQRTPPDRLGDDPFAQSSDPDALRFLVVGVGDDLPGTVNVTSVDASGSGVDVLSDVPLGEVPCPAGTATPLVCGSTPPIRAVADDIDRNHPMVRARSVRAELGGALQVNGAGTELGSIRVGGPRQTPMGPMVRYRARLRVFMVRAAAGGPPPMGGDAAGAAALAQAEVRRANALWGACGISFGPPSELDVRVVDPPRAHLLALGCDQGLPASGGAVRVRVDGVEVGARLTAGMRPSAAARAVAAALLGAGFTARVSDNPAIAAGAHGASDVLVRRRDGSLALLEPPASGSVSTDPTMTACIGGVDLDDGLQHFGDIDAISGTVEERALIKAFDDNDPTTIEVLLVPSFAGGGRIGESFISADGGAVRNTVIEDRAGVRADRASSALSHELGHVLLDEPGHPDDFGLDTPTRLMDADAANPSAYGPRRLLIEECVRAVRQSGPDAVVPLLTAWPLAPIGAARTPPVARPAAPRAPVRGNRR